MVISNKVRDGDAVGDGAKNIFVGGIPPAWQFESMLNANKLHIKHKTPYKISFVGEGNFNPQKVKNVRYKNMETFFLVRNAYTS